MSKFTLKSRKRIEKDRAEAEEVRGIAEKIRSDLPFQEFDEVCNNQTILKALSFYRLILEQEADDIERALDCGDEYGNLRSHSEKEILEGCISLMQEVVGQVQRNLLAADIDIHEPEKDEAGDYIDDEDGTEWWQHWFRSNITYRHIVNRLFLWGTEHSGGTSTCAKCRELGVNPSKEADIGFDPEITEDYY